jgi:hypothetical protein
MANMRKHGFKAVNGDGEEWAGGAGGGGAGGDLDDDGGEPPPPLHPVSGPGEQVEVDTSRWSLKTYLKEEYGAGSPTYKVLWNAAFRKRLCLLIGRAHTLCLS